MRVRSLVGLSVVSLVLVCGCARHKDTYTEVFQDRIVRVRLLRVQDASGRLVPKGYDHPWNVSINRLELLLSSVRYRKTGALFGRREVRGAFPPFQRSLLLRPVQEAFARAEPDQAVDFSFVEKDRSLKVFPRRYRTDGIMFRKDGRLNIAFRNIHFEELQDVEGGEYKARQGDPTARPVRADWVLVPGEGQELAMVEDPGLVGRKEYRNWVRLDLSVRGAPPEPEDARSIHAPGEGASVPGQVVTSPERMPVTRQEVEDRLRFLEELHQEGTLPEPAYLEKRRELEGLLDGLAEPAPR